MHRNFRSSEKRSKTGSPRRSASTISGNRCFTVDIKDIYIHGERRNALLITVLDVCSRSILVQVLWWRLQREQVIWLLPRMLQQHSTKGITLRNDNGSQFIVRAVSDYLPEKQVAQELTHVAIPEENCSIEAYHSILDKQLLQTTEFTDIQEAI